jgi:hypothetical protein
MGISFTTAAGCCLIAAAAGSALVALAELRAVAADDSLSVAEAAGGSAERRAEALASTDAWLFLGVSTGALRELAAARALASDPPDLDRAEALSWKALKRSPGRTEAWTRLAYIDATRHGVLGQEGLSALTHSYEVEPFGQEALRHWRVELVLSRWWEVNEALRDAALREAHAATVDGGARWYEETLWMQGLAGRLPQPARDTLQAAISRHER